ncbi:Bifunctional lycopene cyclase/phytoene synthase [Gossypium arboreum]|uniref:Bifunctional lycopene cyclase/phytoene synthase n=1 Tax=Gossypium arboreum TaxID=29729 RepID=A0A0B0MGB9_GOSAR|nr:Bifunctional lycopene cyclase/phytoene synthase [Gossypium arboreum]
MPTSQTWSYMQSHIDATIPDRVLLAHIYRNHISMPTYKCGLTHTHILESYVMIYVS